MTRIPETSALVLKKMKKLMCEYIIIEQFVTFAESPLDKFRLAKKYLSVFSERFVVSKCDTNLSEKTLAKVCACLQFFLCLAIWLPIIEVKRSN